MIPSQNYTRKSSQNLCLFNVIAPLLLRLLKLKFVNLTLPGYLETEREQEDKTLQQTPPSPCPVQTTHCGY